MTKDSVSHSSPALTWAVLASVGLRPASSWSGSSEGYSDAASTLTQIVGVSCAYPGRADPAAMGQLAALSPSAVAPGTTSSGSFLAAALAGDDLPRLIPSERWDIEAAYAPDVAIDHTYVRHAGFLAAVDCFDAEAFR